MPGQLAKRRTKRFDRVDRRGNGPPDLHMYAAFKYNLAGIKEVSPGLKRVSDRCSTELWSEK